MRKRNSLAIVSAIIPVIGGDEGITTGCGIAALTIDYYELGIKTAQMAIEILENDGDISTMPIGYADTFTWVYDVERAEELGIEIPDYFEPIQ